LQLPKKAHNVIQQYIITKNSAIADGLCNALSVEILSNAAQHNEKSDLKNLAIRK